MGEKHAPTVNAIIESLGITHVLDYGCGSRCSLAKGLKSLERLTYQAYDPGVERFSAAPVPAQFVCCIDVLEHIEPDCLDAVLDDLRRLTEGVLFATIATGPAGKQLSDGRNAHLIQEPIGWWLPRICERFDLQNMASTSNGFLVVAYAKSQVLAPDGKLA